MLKFFRIPFAQSGDRTAIPDAADPSGFVSYTEGYGFDYQRQKTDPASKNIERDKMNQAFFDMTAEVGLLQQHGTPDFITSALNGGSPFEYGIGDRVRYDDGVNGFRVFVSRVATNVDLPTVPASWAPARDFTPAAVAGGTANALTATLVPSLGLMPAGTVFLLRHAAANTTAATLALNGGAAKPIVKQANAPLTAGDIPGAASWGLYVYDLTLDRYFLLNTPAAAPIGEGQTWQNVTGSRALATDFTNTTGRTIAASVTSVVAASGNFNATVGGIVIASQSNNGSGGTAMTLSGLIIPPGAVYRVTGGTLSAWSEMRV